MSNISLTTDVSGELETLRSRLAHEVEARHQAEVELEQKSLELYLANQSLAREVEMASASARDLASSLTQLQQTQAQLIQESKLGALGTLAGGIAHEINTPIQFIGDNVQFVREGMAGLLRLCETALASHPDLRPLAEDIDLDLLREELDPALAEAAHGVARIASIVELVRLYAEPDRIDGTLGDLGPTIDLAVSLSRAQWSPVAELTVDLAPDTPNVLCMMGQMSQALVALIVNAADAIRTRHPPEGGHIRIITRPHPKGAELRIEDNGCGIDPAIEDKIFDPFFTTKPPGHGSGQGLSVVYKILTGNHNGRITIESEVGRGTTFVITLPAAP